MRRDNDQQKIALAVGIALSAGMFSIMPVAYGAPVSDGVKTTGVSITQTTPATPNAPVNTNITSSAQNNVIGWQDFSVAKDESVNFNDNHNYLNIVSGKNTSEIYGAINAQGGNIYLVNPNGVIFGQGSSVNVGSGSFTASTRYLDSLEAKGQVESTPMAEIIGSASSTVASDIVNMGSITANSVVLDGNNIRFMNSGTTGNVVNVTNNDITFKASGEVHIGNTDGETVSNYNIITKKISSLQEEINSLTNQEKISEKQAEIEDIKANSYYKLIKSLGEISSTGNYMLSGNISLPSNDNTTYNGYDGTFSGKIDGMGFTIDGLKATDGGGLFKETAGARIENLGVININISDPNDNYAGGIVGIAGAGTVLQNVYTTGSINGDNSGGLVGKANGVTIDNSYSSVTITGAKGSGFINYVAAGTNTITNSYFDGSAQYGFISKNATKSSTNPLSATVINSYAQSNTGPYMQAGEIKIDHSIVADKSHSKILIFEAQGTDPSEKSYVESLMNYEKVYSDLGWDITSTGGVNIDEDKFVKDTNGQYTTTPNANYGAVTRPTWRIYEGRSTPVLTSMLKGVKTVSYNYGYFDADGDLDKKAVVYNPVNADNPAGIGSNVVSNTSQDIPAYDETNQPTGLVYNGETLKIVDSDNAALTAKDASAFFKNTVGTSTVDVADINYDVNGQRNSTGFETDSNKKITTKNLALLWSGQQGYDLVGSNIAIAPRTVKAITDYSTVKIEKQYDGSEDASPALKNLFSGDSTTTSGILDVDKENVSVAFSGSASFVNANGVADASVGKDKDIIFGADSSISLSFKTGSTAAEIAEIEAAKNNYVLDTEGSAFTDGQKLEKVGTITQADLVIDFASGYGTGINKTYDGTAAVVDATDENNSITKKNLPTAETFALTGIVTPQGSTKEIVSIDLTNAMANYVASNAENASEVSNAGDHVVRYSGLKLTGDDAMNYRLVDKKGNVLYSVAYNGVGADVNKDAGGYLDGSGTIDKKNLSLGGFSVYDDNGNLLAPSKTYNNNQYYDGAEGKTVYSDEVVHWQDSNNQTVWDDLTFTVTKDSAGHSAYFTENEGSTTAVENAGNNYGVAYHVTISGDSADNYTINGADITQNSTKDVTGSGGEIKKRVITLALGGTTADSDKTYDGDAFVKVTHGDTLTNEISLTDGLVKYADGSETLVNGDGTTLSITGEYDSKDVKVSDVYGVGDDQNIHYTITVVDGTISGKADNYVFESETGGTSQTINGAQGAINPVHIKNIQFADVSKTYDTSDQVKGEQDTDTITVNGITDGTNNTNNSVLVDGENLQDIIDATRIKGIYGSGSTDDTFTANAHVQRDSNNDVISGTVKYTGKDTDGNATSLKNSIISNNYVLDKDSEYGVGTINPITITAITLDHDTISKAYDGEKSVAYTDASGNQHEAKEFVHDLYTTVGNTKVVLDYDVVDANYASENVARDDSGNVKKQDVTYTLSVTETGDYAVDSSLKDGNYVVKTFAVADNDGGTITPRKLKAQSAANSFSKTYDANNKVYDAGHNLLSGSGVVNFVGYDNDDDGLLTKDQNENNSTAVYNDVNVNADTDTGKTVNFTAKLGDTVAGNYDIYVDDGNGNWTNGTTFTKNNGFINKAGLYVTFDDVEKVYDGNAYLLSGETSLRAPNYHDGIKTGANGLDDVHVSFASEDDSVFDSAEVVRDTNGQVTSQKVTYKFTLAGNTADNYFIADADGNEVDNKEGDKTVLYGTGTINPKELIDADVVIDFDAVNKVYDTNSAVTFDHSETEYGSQAGSHEAADYISNFTIGGVVLKNALKDTKGIYYTATGIYLNAAGTETSGVDANKARFTISLTDDALSNFDLHLVTFFDADAKTLTKDTAAGGAAITPKNVTVSFSDPEVTKVYNGKTDVVTGSTQADPTGTVMDIGTNILDVSGLINGDAVSFDRDSINARYADKDVAYDGDGNVTSKEVYYDAVLTGDNAKNYQLVYGNDTSTLVNGKPSLTLTGSGTITPKEIAADFVYDGNVAEADYNKTDGDTTANKAYDTTDNVNILTSNTITGVNGEVIKLQDTDIIGTYGKWTADSNGAQTGIKDAAGNTEQGTFTANGDVNWLETGNTEDEKTGYKAVKYTGLQNALAAATDENNTAGFSGKNYTIADTVYFTEAAQKGKIRRLALTADDVQEKWTAPITKEYDGSYEVLNPEQHLTIYTMVTGSEVDLKYNLDSAVYDNNQVNVVSGHGVTYTLNNLQSQEFSNFMMDDALLSKYQGKEFKSGTNGMPTGSITPRVLKINLTTPDGYVKTYDGTNNVKDSSGNIINNFAYEYQTDKTSILDKDAGTVKLAVTGAYETADANKTLAGTTISGRPDKKTIKYTVKLTGNDAGNYTLAAAAHPAAGASTEVDSTTYTGQGDIKQRKVYVDFEDAINPDTGEKYGTKIDKTYDGNAAADGTNTHRDHINFVVADGDTGMIDTGITLVKEGNDGITAEYVATETVQAKDVARGGQGQVLTKDVYFSNFNLTGEGKDNYAVRAKDAKGNDSDKLIGQGTINPMAVTVTLKDAPSKVYDGNTAIEADDIAKTNFTITPTTVITGDDVANDIAITGNYQGTSETAANAGTDKAYTYNLTLNNNNYKLVDINDANGRTTTAGNEGMTAELTGADGEITPRTISRDTIAEMSKVYDGTQDADTGYMNNLANNITFNNVVNNENLRLTGSAEYMDNANAGEHQVKYTITIGNTNYQLADGSREFTDYGTGVIDRRGLIVTAAPVSVNVGEAMPAFTGTVKGFARNEQDNYADFISGFTFKADDGVTTNAPGSYGVYGWYMGNKSGLFGQNYTYAQAPANATALNVNYVNTTGIPDTKITPNNNIYNQISKDMNSGFGDNGLAAIEYKNKQGKTLAMENINSGAIHGTGQELGVGAEDEAQQADTLADIGIVGGDIVNMDGVEAASNANIEVSGDGTTVNLEALSLRGDADASGSNLAGSSGENINNGAAQIEITDRQGNVLSDNIEDKEKEGEIAIESKSSQDNDEIELKVEATGVNVA